MHFLNYYVRHRQLGTKACKFVLVHVHNILLVISSEPCCVLGKVLGWLKFFINTHWNRNASSTNRKYHCFVLSPHTWFLPRTASSLPCTRPPRRRWSGWRAPGRAGRAGPSLTAASQQMWLSFPADRLQGKKREIQTQRERETWDKPETYILNRVKIYQ